MTLYEILGVPATASAEEIKSAYRRKARETHPDRGGDREAFQRVQHAYDVLGDPSRKARYDECGEQTEAPLVPSPTEMLASAFDIVLQDERGVSSPLAVLKIVLQERLRVERASLAKHEREIKRWRRILERLERKTGDAVLEMVLERRIQPHVHGAEVARGWIEGVQIALGMADGYRYHAGSADFAMGDLLVGLSEHLEERPRRRTNRREAA